MRPSTLCADAPWLSLAAHFWKDLSSKFLVSLPESGGWSSPTPMGVATSITTPLGETQLLAQASPFLELWGGATPLATPLGVATLTTPPLDVSLSAPPAASSDDPT